MASSSSTLKTAKALGLTIETSNQSGVGGKDEESATALGPDYAVVADSAVG